MRADRQTIPIFSGVFGPSMPIPKKPLPGWGTSTFGYKSFRLSLSHNVNNFLVSILIHFCHKIIPMICNNTAQPDYIFVETYH